MKLKIGDRVRVYNGWKVITGRVEDEAWVTGTTRPKRRVIYVIEDGFSSCHEDGPFHERQCRRLVNGKKK